MMVKAYFLMLQRDEWLAGLQTHFEVRATS